MGQPEHIGARKLRMRLMLALAAEGTCLMSRHSWVCILELGGAYLEEHGESTGSG